MDQVSIFFLIFYFFRSELRGCDCFIPLFIQQILYVIYVPAIVQNTGDVAVCKYNLSLHEADSLVGINPQNHSNIHKTVTVMNTIKV